MSELPILTTEFTSKLERHISLEATESSISSSYQVVSFGKTFAKKVRGYWPPSAVYCFNKDDVGHLDEILQFFGDVKPFFYLAHSGFDSEVAQKLTAAGFYMADWTQTILYGLPLKDAPRLPAGITIEQVTYESIELAAEIAAEGNEWPKEWRESAKDGVRKSIQQPHFQLYLASLNNEPAGIGDLSLRNDGWSTMGGAAVPPRFRKKGIHSALIQHRLHEAHKNKSELVVGCANFDSASFRNQQRLGMRLGYIEATWKARL